MEQLAIEFSDLENSLLEQTEINETELRLLYVASQVVSRDFENHPHAFYFGAVVLKWRWMGMSSI